MKAAESKDTVKRGKGRERSLDLEDLEFFKGHCLRESTEKGSGDSLSYLHSWELSSAGH